MRRFEVLLKSGTAIRVPRDFDAEALSRLARDDLGAALAAKGRVGKYAVAHPVSANTLYALGLMSLRKNELGKSKGYFQQLARLAPNRSEAHYNLGLIHLREGSECDAQAAMQRFRDLKAREDEAARSEIGISRQETPSYSNTPSPLPT